jgi:hypothetical protein
MSSLSTISNNLSLSEETQQLLDEALAEFESEERAAAKKVIQERLREIKRLEILLERSKADLAKLLKLGVEEILMINY